MSTLPGLPKKIDEKLEPFEFAIRKLGANAGLVEALREQEDRDGTRSDALKQMYDTFREVLGIEGAAVKDEDAAVINVKAKIREILQVDQLISIREYLIQKATSVQISGKKPGIMP